MSNYHILIQSEDKKTITMALHYTVPVASQNEVGYLHRDLIAMVRKVFITNPSTGLVVGSIESRVPYLADDFAAEYAQLQTGEVIEEITTYRFSILGMTPIEKKAEIDAVWTVKQAETFAKLQAQLEFYHYDGDAA